jgi:galactokinase
MDSSFRAAFGQDFTASTAVPGRVNLLGEWIDFSGGLVLPMSLPLDVRIASAPNGLEVDRIVSAQFGGPVIRNPGDRASGCWSDYVAGALSKARALGWTDKGGLDVALDSAVPHGSGLSSSAAVIVGMLRVLAPAQTSRTQIALHAKAVENDYIGVPCGIMDQMAVAIAAPGSVLALDTGKLAFDVVPLPAGWRISIIHSGVSRKLADGRYKLLRDEILEAARLLDVDLLVKADVWACDRLPLRLAACARHVVTEDTRTRAALSCLKAGDLAEFGRAMRDGHRSISRDLGITTPEIDAQVALIEQHGATAARQTGGGFGGCIVILEDADEPSRWWQPLAAAFPDVRRII